MLLLYCPNFCSDGRQFLIVVASKYLVFCERQQRVADLENVLRFSQSSSGLKLFHQLQMKASKMVFVFGLVPVFSGMSRNTVSQLAGRYLTRSPSPQMSEGCLPLLLSCPRQIDGAP
jgi:hypothetical protein